MMQQLNAKQRWQALQWLEVMGFSLADIARNYGIEINALAAELRLARLERLEKRKTA